MRRAILSVAMLLACGSALVAAPAVKAGSAKDAAAKNTTSKDAANKETADKDAEKKDAEKGVKKGPTLAERRAATAQQKAQEASKRMFQKFDTNKDNKLSQAEWTKAQPTLDKMLEADMLKAASNRDAAKRALQGVAKPDVQRDNGEQISAEAFENYCKQYAESGTEAMRGVADAVSPPADRPEDRKTDAQRRREDVKRQARGDNGPSASDRNAAQERQRQRDEEQFKRDEALRRRGIPSGRPDGAIPNRPRPPQK